MNIEFRESFLQDLRSIKDKTIKSKLQDIIVSIKNTENLSTVSNRLLAEMPKQGLEVFNLCILNRPIQEVYLICISLPLPDLGNISNEIYCEIDSRS